MRLSELKLNCPKCSHRTDASNMRKHIKVKHDEEAMTTFNAAFLAKKAELNGSEVQTCDLCGHQCASLSGLKSHKRERHGNREKAVVAVDPATISVFGGDGENGERSGEGTSEPPRKRFHGVIEGDLATSRETADGGGSSRRISCPFPDCNVAVSTRSLLVGHVNSHDSRFVLENNRFDREEDMRKWVADRCKETTTSFIVNKTVANSNGKTIYHHCQHEGCYERTGDVRYGHDTKKQTKKDTCPAFLRISISSDCSSFNVIGCFQHHGHEQKIPSLKLSNEEKEIILKYMKDNLTNRQIVEKLCTEYSTSDRLHYVTYDDLRNFRRKEKLHPGRRNEEDLVSLLMRVEEKNEEDGIRLYNPPENATGEGFRLVIITPQQLEFLTKYSHRGVTLDDIHHCSKYNLKLSTMLVCDGYDRGVPVGFLLSHSTTSSDIEELFKCVKQLHPSFNPAHVMTDEANVFWLGFRKVFPTTPTRKVLCRWHICRTWKKQAKIMLEEEHVGKLMPKLRELLREAVQANFTKRISEILHFLSELPNGEGAQFEEYFRSRYLAKCEEWSTVEREGIIFHTSMYAEAWHSLLKTQILDGKKNIRADTLVHQLYRAIEYVIQKNFIQIARKLARGIPRLAKNHKNCRVAAASLKEYVVLPEPAEYEGELEFLVGRVGGDVESMYRVVQKASCMCLKNENCHCNCGACGYKHSCTCLVQEAGVCCKHVHMVLLSNDRFTPDSYSSCHSPVFDAPSGSFPSPSSTSLSIRPAAPVSLDDVDQTEKDNALKNFDKLVNAHSALEEHLRQLMKRNSRSAADEIQKALDSVMALLPNSQPSLPPRRASATNCSARDVMNKHIRLEPRRYSRPCPPSTSSAPLVPIAELSVCSICLQVDAPLPEDADPMEDSAQWNYWKQCPECELPAHWECALAQRLCAHCNVAFVSYE